MSISSLIKSSGSAQTLKAAKKNAGIPNSIEEHPALVSHDRFRDQLLAKLQDFQEELDSMQMSNDPLDVSDEAVQRDAKTIRYRNAIASLEGDLKSHDATRNQDFNNASTDIVNRMCDTLQRPLLKKAVEHFEAIKQTYQELGELYMIAQRTGVSRGIERLQFPTAQINERQLDRAIETYNGRIE
ncbi:hypothetical protein OAL44_00640 [Planctomycetaceae bacterium]|nr:hypothetical protein [Planctomycetaceae bacterium]